MPKGDNDFQSTYNYQFGPLLYYSSNIQNVSFLNMQVMLAVGSAIYGSMLGVQQTTAWIQTRDAQAGGRGRVLTIKGKRVLRKFQVQRLQVSLSI